MALAKRHRCPKAQEKLRQLLSPRNRGTLQSVPGAAGHRLSRFSSSVGLLAFHLFLLPICVRSSCTCTMFQKNETKTQTLHCLKEGISKGWDVERRKGTPQKQAVQLQLQHQKWSKKLEKNKKANTTRPNHFPHSYMAYLHQLPFHFKNQKKRENKHNPQPNHLPSSYMAPRENLDQLPFNKCQTISKKLQKPVFKEKNYLMVSCFAI